MFVFTKISNYRQKANVSDRGGTFIRKVAVDNDSPIRQPALTEDDVQEEADRRLSGMPDRDCEEMLREMLPTLAAESLPDIAIVPVFCMFTIKLLR